MPGTRAPGGSSLCLGSRLKRAEEGEEGTSSKLSQGLAPQHPGHDPSRVSVLGRAVTGPPKRPALPNGWSAADGDSYRSLLHQRPSPTSDVRVVHHVRSPVVWRPPGESRSQSVSSAVPGHGDLPGPQDKRKGT